LRRPGVSVAAAQAELDSLVRWIDALIESRFGPEDESPE
jgi:hypothetical protein